MHLAVVVDFQHVSQAVAQGIELVGVLTAEDQEGGHVVASGTIGDKVLDGLELTAVRAAAGGLALAGGLVGGGGRLAVGGGGRRVSLAAVVLLAAVSTGGEDHHCGQGQGKDPCKFFLHFIAPIQNFAKKRSTPRIPTHTKTHIGTITINLPFFPRAGRKWSWDHFRGISPGKCLALAYSIYHTASALSRCPSYSPNFLCNIAKSHKSSQSPFSSPLFLCESSPQRSNRKISYQFKVLYSQKTPRFFNKIPLFYNKRARRGCPGGPGEADQRLA